MEVQANTPPSSGATWKPAQLVVLCSVCLVVGLLVGYFVRGSEGASPSAVGPVSQAQMTPTAATMPPSAAKQPQAPQQMPSLDDMRRMAAKKAEPLLAQLKNNPKDPKLLNQVGLIYKATHQFKEAGSYFEQSLQYDPKDIAVRADYASCLYFTGDIDGALAQLNKSLTYDPKHAGTLMNIGIIKWKGKNDVSGAIDSWQKVLKYHPDFPQKEMVEHMIQQAKQSEEKPITTADKG